MRDADALDNNPQILPADLEACHEELFGWCLSRCDFDRAGAEDLMQQTYVEVLSGRAQFAGRSSLRTFLFAVANNLNRSRFRRLKSRLRLRQRWLDDTATAESPPLPDFGNARIWLAVRSLPRQQRDVVELVFCRDMSLRDAATVMRVAVGTARIHYDRAKKNLALALAELRDPVSGGSGR